MSCTLVHTQHGLKHFYSAQDGWTAQFLTSDRNAILEMYTSIDQDAQYINTGLDELWLFHSHDFIPILFCNTLLLCAINFMSKSNSDCLNFAACLLPFSLLTKVVT